jgi:hypothetical protein
MVNLIVIYMIVYVVWTASFYVRKPSVRAFCLLKHWYRLHAQSFPLFYIVPPPSYWSVGTAQHSPDCGTPWNP